MNLFTTTAIAVIFLLASFASAVPTKRSKLVDLLFLNYDKHVRPNYGEEPVNVQVSVYIVDNVAVAETKTHLSLETLLYFRRGWNDSRLQFDGEKPLVGGKELKDKIWTPDLFFATSFRVTSFETPESNTFVRISPDGSVLLSERIAVQWRCKQSWEKFPCDTLQCDLETESFSFNTADIRVTMKKDGIGFSDATSIENFLIDNVAFKEKHVTLSSGTYDRLVIQLSLKRNIPDVKYIMAEDKRYPDFYSSIPLNLRVDSCEKSMEVDK